MINAVTLQLFIVKLEEEEIDIEEADVTAALVVLYLCTQPKQRLTTNLPKCIFPLPPVAL